MGELGWGSRLSLFVMKAIKQAEAVNHIRGLLRERGFDIRSRPLGGQGRIIFEYEGRQIGMDSASGVWIRQTDKGDWRCVATPCSVSGAIQAVEFLTTEKLWQ